MLDIPWLNTSVEILEFSLNFSNKYPITKKIVDMQHNVGAKADIVRIEVIAQLFLGSLKGQSDEFWFWDTCMSWLHTKSFRIRPYLRNLMIFFTSYA